MTVFVAGTVFGEVQLSVFLAGGVFGEFWNDSLSGEMLYFSTKCP